MAVESSGQPQEVDLDSTDKLPILEGVEFDPDVADDAVRMDRATAGQGVSLTANSAQSELLRPASIDLPSLAESMRSVEERIARQSAEYGALTRAHERALEAEAAATARAEEAARESERQQAAARTLRDSLAARDATIVQVLHSLGERDAQLSALQAEHARALPALEARVQSSTYLQEELLSVRSELATALADFKSSQDHVRALGAQLTRAESEINAARADLSLANTQAVSYLELLRTRDWRRGFDQNLFRDMDTKVGAAHADRESLTAERDRNQGQVTALEASVAAQKATIEKLQSAAAAQVSAAAQQAKNFGNAEQQRAEWLAKLSAAESETTRLAAELAARDQALAEAQAALSGSLQRMAQLQSEHAAKIAELEADSETREEEMTVLMAHLQEARRPIGSIEGDARRSSEELALKSAALADLTQETDKLRAALERTRAALEEREFLIRRLERSESNNANVLGRIQTSMERLGSVAAPGSGVAVGTEWSPELIRIDGDRSISHTLGRRTRIGRAPGCELHIDSSSVSRHHALILAGTREAIIEDLNSTNGVILNGRKVTRQVLNDGDIVTIGEIQFRYVAKPSSVPLKG
jgi:chromosome segregation ATPase